MAAGVNPDPTKEEILEFLREPDNVGKRMTAKEIAQAMHFQGRKNVNKQLYSLSKEKLVVNDERVKPPLWWLPDSGPPDVDDISAVSQEMSEVSLQPLPKQTVPPPCPPFLDQNLDDALVALLPDLRTGLSLVDLLPRLERPAGGFMTRAERAKVQVLPSDPDRVSEIVDILRKKSNEDFSRFLAILDVSGNELWAKNLRDRISLGSLPPSTAPSSPSTMDATSQDDAWKLKAAYEEALEKQGSVSVDVTRCLFIGPPGVGKSSLKHLLIHNKSKAVQISTPMMEAPDVVRITSEQYALEQGSSSWQLMEGDAIRRSVQLSALRKKYQVNQPFQIDLSAADQDPDSSTSGGIQPSQPLYCSQYPDQRNSELTDILSQFLSSKESVQDGVILNNASFLHLLDSGGQPCFLDVLPLLLSVPCSYVLVFNASQDLNQPLPVTYRPRENSTSTQELSSSQTGRELIQRMMSSFHTMGVKHAKDMEHFQTPGTQSPQPSIHLIGTFKDVLLREDRLEEQKKTLNEAVTFLSSYPVFKYLAKDESSAQSSTFYLVNNNMTEEEQCSPAEFEYIEHLRSSLCQSKAAFRMKVPLMWYLLQQVVSKYDRKLLPYSEFEDFALENQLVNSKEHFFQFITLFHMLGFFTFLEFSLNASKESALVCTDTSFFCQEASKILSIQFAKVRSQESCSFQSNGILGPSSHIVLEELNISKKMDQAWLLKSLVHTGIAAKINKDNLFIPAALPFKEIHSLQASVATLCASFKIREHSLSRKFMILHQGVFCKLAVELASNPLCDFIHSESCRSSINFFFENSNINLMENTTFLEVAVTFEESFSSLGTCSDQLKQAAHQCCSNVLKMIKTAITKVSEDMFGPPSVDVGEVVVGFKCTCGADMPHMAVVDEKNLSLRCIGGKRENRLPKLSLNQLIWFEQLGAQDCHLQLTLQGTEDSKCYVLQEVSTDAPMPLPCPPSLSLDQNLDDALVALLPDLRTRLSLDDLLPRLERPAGGFMTKAERAKVQALPSDLDRVSEIVDILRKKSNEDFRLFVAILDESGNELWAKNLRDRISLGHESVLLDKCFIPFGIKTVQIDQFGGVYCLEPTTEGVEDPHSDDSEQQRSDDDNDDDGDDDDDIDDDDDDEGTGSHRKSRDIGVGREEENRFKIEVPDGALKQESLEVRSAIIFSGPWRLPEGYTLANPVLYISFDCTAVTKPIIVRVPHWIAQVSSLSAVDCPLAIAPHDLPEDASKYSFSFLDQENCSVGARYSTIKLSGHCCLLTQLAIKELESKGQVRYSATAWTRRGQPFDSLSGFTFRVPVIFDLPIWDRVLEKYFKVNKWTRHDCFPPIDFEFHPPNQASLSGSLTEKSGPGWEASLNREMLPQSCVWCEEQALEYKLEKDAYPPSFTITVDYVWSDCEQYTGSPKKKKVVSLVVSGTDSGSITFSFKVKEAVYLSETGSLPSLRSPSTASRNGSPMEAPMARMEDKIDSSLDIFGVEAYNKGLIGDMTILGAVLGIAEEAEAIINRNGTINSQLLKILDLYIAKESPTWGDFCTALEKYYGFNKVRDKIQRDHNYKALECT